MAFRQPSDALSDVAAAQKRRVGYEVERAATRVRRSIPLSGDPRPLGLARSAIPSLGVIPAIVTTAITACVLSSGTYTYGTGNAALYFVANGATTMTADANNNNVVVWNWYQHSGTIATGTSVWLGCWSGGYWFLGSDC